MDGRIVELGLKRTSSTSERIAALREAGFTVNGLANILGITRQSLRNWQKDIHSARPEEAMKRLDNLRFAMGQLVTKRELQADEAAQWMQSLPEDPPYIRPVDLIVKDPLKVFETIGSSNVAEGLQY